MTSEEEVMPENEELLSNVLNEPEGESRRKKKRKKKKRKKKDKDTDTDMDLKKSRPDKENSIEKKNQEERSVMENDSLDLSRIDVESSVGSSSSNSYHEIRPESVVGINISPESIVNIQISPESIVNIKISPGSVVDNEHPSERVVDNVIEQEAVIVEEVAQELVVGNELAPESDHNEPSPLVAECHHLILEPVNNSGTSDSVSDNSDPVLDSVEDDGVLPIRKVVPELVDFLTTYDTVILLGETGCGKSTQVPQIIFENNIHKGRLIYVTQPRRLAAVGLARRVDEEMVAQGIIGKVGHKVRFDHNVGPNAEIVYLTDGMAVQERLTDSLFSKCRFLILDEAHERSLDTDILFGVVKAAQKKRARRDPLKVLVMSAALNVKKIKEFFPGAPILRSTGRVYPVSVKATVDDIEDYFYACLVTLFNIHKSYPVGGDILMFLSGQAEIKRMEKAVRYITASEGFVGYPPLIPRTLYSTLDPYEQDLALEPAPEGSRKVIISTNIAETSVTIPNIHYVIDSGRVKVKFHNPVTGIDSLHVVMVSKEQALQRAGRAGRVAPGICFRTYSDRQYSNLPKSSIPEIQRSSMLSTILKISAMGFDPFDFRFLSKPSVESMREATKDLVDLQAFKESENLSITALGRKMAQIPLDPRFAKIVLSSLRTCIKSTDEILDIVSMLSSDSIFITSVPSDVNVHEVRSPFYSYLGDHITLCNIYRGFMSASDRKAFCERYYLNYGAMNFVLDTKSQIVIWLTSQGYNIDTCNEAWKNVISCLATGLFKNVAVLMPDKFYYVVHSKKIAKIHPLSVLHSTYPDYVMFTEIIDTGEALFLKNVSTITPETITLNVPGYIIRNDVRIPRNDGQGSSKFPDWPPNDLTIANEHCQSSNHKSQCECIMMFYENSLNEDNPYREYFSEDGEMDNLNQLNRTGRSWSFVDSDDESDNSTDADLNELAAAVSVDVDNGNWSDDSTLSVEKASLVLYNKHGLKPHSRPPTPVSPTGSLDEHENQPGPSGMVYDSIVPPYPSMLGSKSAEPDPLYSPSELYRPVTPGPRSFSPFVPVTSPIGQPPCYQFPPVTAENRNSDSRFNWPFEYITWPPRLLAGAKIPAIDSDQPTSSGLGPILKNLPVPSGSSQYSNNYPPLPFETESSMVTPLLYPSPYSSNFSSDESPLSFVRSPENATPENSFPEPPVSFSDDLVTNRPVSFSSDLITNRPVSFSGDLVTNRPVSFSSDLVTNRPVSFSSDLVTNRPVSFSSDLVTNRPVSFSSDLVTNRLVSFSGDLVTNRPVSFSGDLAINRPVSFSGDLATNRPVSFSGDLVTNRRQLPLLRPRAIAGAHIANEPQMRVPSFERGPWSNVPSTSESLNASTWNVGSRNDSDSWRTEPFRIAQLTPQNLNLNPSNFRPLNFGSPGSVNASSSGAGPSRESTIIGSSNVDALNPVTSNSGPSIAESPAVDPNSAAQAEPTPAEGGNGASTSWHPLSSAFHVCSLHIADQNEKKNP